MLSRLLNLLEESGQHEPHQSAYRSAHSTETDLVRVSREILSALDRREGVFLVLLDLTAAFDTIDRELMLNRLSNIGVEGTALKWFSSYLQDRHQSVSISGSTSKSMPLRFGVPQGSVLGPFLFTQYTVAIGKICGRHGVGYQLYAGDTQVYITFKVDSIIDQQTALARIQACIEEIRIRMILHKLIMNDSKTEFVIVVSSDSVDKMFIDTITIGDSSVSPSGSARNIGFIFDKTLCLNDHITEDLPLLAKEHPLHKTFSQPYCNTTPCSGACTVEVDYYNALYVATTWTSTTYTECCCTLHHLCTRAGTHITCFDAAALVKKTTADYF